MAAYEQLLAAFKGMMPPDVLAKEGTAEFGDLFNRWTADVEKEFGVQGWEAIPADQLATLEFNPASAGTAATTTTGPAENQIFNQIAPGLAAQVQGDPTRTAAVADLTKQTDAAFGTLRDTLGQAQAFFDGDAYLNQYPQVAQLFAQQNPGAADGTRSIVTPAGPRDMTAQQFAEFHYNNFGKNEGLLPTYRSDVSAAATNTINQTTAAQTAAATVATKAKLDALAESLASMQTNLQGALGQQAVALATAVASYSANLDTLDATQRKNLADQLAAQQANLEQSIASQRTALAQQVQELQGNATAAAAARRVALEQQIAALTAAQAPVAEARIRGAEALTTAINLGLESTTDQLRADAARDGFIGGSTMQDSALARAVVGARQDASRAGADARLANAMDTREIARTGAGGSFSISDVLAGDTQRIGDAGATGRYGLSTDLATGRRTIGDAGAAGVRTIGDTTAGARANLGNYAAGTTYENTTQGNQASLALNQQGAAGRYDLAAALADETAAAANLNAAAKADAAGRLFPASLNAAQTLTTLPAANAGANAALIPYGTAGTRNTLDLLGWLSNPTAAPVPTAVTTTPSTVGNSISGLGANLIGSAFQIGNWGQPATGVPAPVKKNAAAYNPWSWQGTPSNRGAIA